MALLPSPFLSISSLRGRCRLDRLLSVENTVLMSSAVIPWSSVEVKLEDVPVFEGPATSERVYVPAGKQCFICKPHYKHVSKAMHQGLIGGQIADASSRGTAPGRNPLFQSVRLSFGFMLLVSLLAGCVLVDGAPKTPAAGWCRTKHRPNKPAQSGYKGYCKACFRKHFPEEHMAKVLLRRKTCGVCAETKNITSDGVCKPCRTARACAGCDEVNLEVHSATCLFCETSRARLGATRPRLAMWCVSCYSEESFASGRCASCYRKTLGKCAHCEAHDVQITRTVKCNESALRGYDVFLWPV